MDNTPNTRDSEVKLLEVDDDYQRASVSPSNMGSDSNLAIGYSMRFTSSTGTSKVGNSLLDSSQRSSVHDSDGFGAHSRSESLSS
jgi:hypothetical protein